MENYISLMVIHILLWDIYLYYSQDGGIVATATADYTLNIFESNSLRVSEI